MAVIICGLWLTGCMQISSYQKSVYDDAGKIAAVGDSYSFAQRTGGFSADKFLVKFKGFSGKQTVWKLSAKDSCTITLAYKAVISSGLFKTCLVGPERQVTVIAEGAVSDQLTVDLQKGDHEIVIAGRDASGEIEMTIAENDQVTVVPVESN